MRDKIIAFLKIAFAALCASQGVIVSYDEEEDEDEDGADGAS
jgi:hypothetical protein